MAINYCKRYVLILAHKAQVVRHHPNTLSESPQPLYFRCSIYLRVRMKQFVSTLFLISLAGCAEERDGYVCYDLRDGDAVAATAKFDRLSGELQGYDAFDTNGLAFSIDARNSHDFDCRTPEQARADKIAWEEAVARANQKAAKARKEADEREAAINALADAMEARGDDAFNEAEAAEDDAFNDAVNEAADEAAKEAVEAAN